MTMHRVSSRSGIGGGQIPPGLWPGGGGGGEGEKIFFDDGQVKVTESLVIIGPPWNRAFAVSQIRGVTHGKNRSMDLSNSILKLVGMLLIFAGVLSWAAGFVVGFFAGVLTGIGVIWGRPKPDAPYCVNLSLGDAWATEYLSTANEKWAETLAAAIAEAVGHRSQDRGFISGQDQLRN